MDNFQTLLILMVVIWIFGKIFRYLNLPVIFGELVGGIIVGPAVLGIVQPNSEVIKILAELGIFFLMLHAGLEADPKELFHSSKKSFLIAIGGAALPFVAGYFVAIQFGYNFESALFIGMGLSITAIAIAARLLKDYELQGTSIGHITLSALVINEILAFILFSVILNLTQSSGFEWRVLILTILKIIIFFGAVLYVGYKTSNHLPKFLCKKGFTLTLISALVLGLIAESIGLHIILGAFLAGLFIREEIVDQKIYQKLEDRIYGLSYSFLGPIFFVSLAFNLDFGIIIRTPLFLIIIITIAIVGKVIGAGLMAAAQGIKWRDAWTIGLAMNSRGAVDLVIASIGVKAGIINEEVFSILVFMAFSATLSSIFLMKPLIKNRA